jgi:hypothetical protein
MTKAAHRDNASGADDMSYQRTKRMTRGVRLYPSSPGLTRGSDPHRAAIDPRVKPVDECVREDASSAWCKSVPGLVAARKSKVTASSRDGVESNRR